VHSFVHFLLTAYRSVWSWVAAQDDSTWSKTPAPDGPIDHLKVSEVDTTQWVESFTFVGENHETTLKHLSIPLPITFGTPPHFDQYGSPVLVTSKRCDTSLSETWIWTPTKKRAFRILIDTAASIPIENHDSAMLLSGFVRCPARVEIESNDVVHVRCFEIKYLNTVWTGQHFITKIN